MGSEFTGSKIQRSVLTVEQICITVENSMRHRIYRLCIFNHSTAIFAHLKFLHTLDIAVSCILIGNLQGKGVKAVSENLCKFRYSECILIRLPYLSVIDVPDATFTVKACNWFEIIRKGIADSDFLTLIAGLCMRFHFLQCKRDV